MGLKFYILYQPILLKNAANWFISSGSILYRPSGIFLEPSYYAQYASVAIIIVLFPPAGKKPNLRRAYLMIIGTLCTTSGMGIVLCACIFGYYILFNSQNRKRSTIKMFVSLIVGIAVFALLLRIPFIGLAFQRIYAPIDSSSGTGFGRMMYWDRYIGSMSARGLIFGYGESRRVSVYMTSLMIFLYKYGVAGCLLCVQSIIRVIRNKFCIATICVCLVYLGLLVISDQTNFIQMIY